MSEACFEGLDLFWDQVAENGFRIFYFNTLITLLLSKGLSLLVTVSILSIFQKSPHHLSLDFATPFRH